MNYPEFYFIAFAIIISIQLVKIAKLTYINSYYKTKLNNLGVDIEHVKNKNLIQMIKN